MVPAKLPQSHPTLCDPMNVAHQAPLSMGFSRQKHWNGLPFPSPEDLPDPRIEPVSLTYPVLGGRFFFLPRVTPGSPNALMKSFNLTIFLMLLSIYAETSNIW